MKCKICSSLLTYTNELAICECDQYWIYKYGSELVAIPHNYSLVLYYNFGGKKWANIIGVNIIGVDGLKTIEDLGYLEKLTPEFAKQILEKLKLLEKFI